MRRVDRLLLANTKFLQGVALVQATAGFVDMVAAYPALEKLFGDSTSAAFDPRYQCQHEPLFSDRALDRLINALTAAQLDVLAGPVGVDTMNSLTDDIRYVVPRRSTPSRERMTVASTRDVVRAALCVALMMAVNAAMNSVVRTRAAGAKPKKAVSKRKRRTP